MKKNLKNVKVAIAMSGGLDSSMAAKFLKDEGYDCLGIFMRLGIERGCCDEAAARQVCQKLGIKFYPLDLKSKFEKEVKKYFLDSYQQGITPNPCIKCNQLIKFGELLKKAETLGCNYLATGHYVKLTRLRPAKTGLRRGAETICKIYRPKDLSKDQTYFLYNLTQDQLKHLFFPAGDMIKKELRLKAEKEKLPHLKQESQDVCFLSGDHNDYLKSNLKLKTGIIKTLTGKIIGEHQGLPLYTIGQRKGLEVGGSGPYYVVRSDYKTNILYVTDKIDDKSLLSKELIVDKINWLAGQAPKFPFKCSAVIRYRHPEESCIIKKSKFGLKVIFSKPQRAITPGQSVVFYKKKELLGGGIIK